MKKQSIGQIGLMMGLITLLALSGCNAAATNTPAATSPAPAVVETTTAAKVAAVAMPDVTAVDAEGNTTVDAGALNAVLADLPAMGLTAEEMAALRFMREEEKLAHDVYITLYAIWKLLLFENIANSEQTHTEAVLTLLERYGIADPVGANGVGVFTDPALQTLYDQLVIQGNPSLGAALKVGAAIEEIDILDLEERSAQTDNEDIRLVYANLTKGSRNHLRAFVQTLARQTGETYTPHYLSQAAYDAILNSAAERGPGASNGNRGRRGRK